MKTNQHMIVLAREAAGKTQTSLAISSGISQAQLSKIEHGLEDPDGKVLSLIATACEVPLEFFFQEADLLSNDLVDFYHRKRLTLPARPFRKAQAKATMTKFQVSQLLKSIEFTDVALLPNKDEIREMTIPEFAEYVRAFWKIPNGPIQNLVGIIESCGIIVMHDDLGHRKHFAMTLRDKSDHNIVILNNTASASDMRFSLAHELAHLLLHQNSTNTDIEKEADLFAASFLMPKSDISSEFKKLKFRDLGALKRYWKVPYGSLIMRAYELGFISERQKKSFFMELSRLKNGSTVEPDEFDIEQPRLLKSIIEHYQNDLQYSVDDLAKVTIMLKAIFMSKYMDVKTRTLRAVGGKSLSSYSLVQS